MPSLLMQHGTPKGLTCTPSPALLLPLPCPPVAEVVLDPAKSWLSFLLLLLWSAAKLGETGWRLLKEDPSLGGRLPGGGEGRRRGVGWRGRWCALHVAHAVHGAVVRGGGAARCAYKALAVGPGSSIPAEYQCPKTTAYHTTRL